MEFLGDSKGLNKAADQVERKTSSLGTKLAHVGKVAALGLAAGVGVAAVAAVKFGKAAAEDQQQAALLAKSLKNSANATKGQVAATEQWISKQGVAKGVADDQLRPALMNLVRATGSVSKAQKLAGLAMDISAGTGKDLGAVSIALAKAQNGNVGALGRLGIKVQDFTKDTGALKNAQIAVKSAQLAYTKAVEAHGPKSAEAAIASDKVALAQRKLGEAQGKAKKQTISFDEAVGRMSKQFGGAATTKANTLQGKMDRLKLVMSETGEAIGYKLIPFASKLAEWFLKLVKGMQDGTGAGGDLRDRLEKVGEVLKKVGKAVLNVTGFAKDHRKELIALTGVIVALVAITRIHAAVMAVQAAGGMLKYLQATKLVSAATKVFAAVQWLMNAALEANPIGIVVVAIAALAAGLVYAYKHSETFRKVVDGAFKGVSKAASFMWNNVLKPTFKFLINAWLAVAGAIVHGAANAFGWVPGLGPKLKAAARNFDTFKERVNNQINGIHNPKIKVTTPGADTAISTLKTIKKLIHDVTTSAPHVKGGGGPLTQLFPTNARGTSNWRGGPTWVGERGPEIVSPPAGSRIYPAAQSARMAGRGGGSTVVNLNFNGLTTDPVAVGREVRKALLALERATGKQVLVRG